MARLPKCWCVHLSGVTTPILLQPLLCIRASLFVSGSELMDSLQSLYFISLFSICFSAALSLRTGQSKTIKNHLSIAK